MAKPILNSPGVVSCVRRCEAAAVAQHVGVQRKSKGIALANAFELSATLQERDRSPIFQGHGRFHSQ